MTEPHPFKALCSYAYFRTYDMTKLASDTPGPRPMVFADSGAHSARTLGIHLTLDSYEQWCRKWESHFNVYANLDVIGAPQSTWDNQQELERRGFAPIPVFHTGTPWYWLEKYLDSGYTYIALGALLGHPEKQVMPWLAKAFKMANGRAVFHGFGMTVWRALREFPFYSVDSSTWGAAFRYGRIALFDRGRWTNLKLRDRAKVLRHRNLIRAHGADPAALVSKETYDPAVAAGVSAVAYRRAETYLRHLHGPIHIPPGPKTPQKDDADTTTGLNLYLADTDPVNLKRGAAGLHLYLACANTTRIQDASNTLYAYNRKEDR